MMSYGNSKKGVFIYYRKYQVTDFKKKLLARRFVMFLITFEIIICYRPALRGEAMLAPIVIDAVFANQPLAMR